MIEKEMKINKQKLIKDATALCAIDKNNNCMVAIKDPKDTKLEDLIYYPDTYDIGCICTVVNDNRYNQIMPSIYTMLFYNLNVIPKVRCGNEYGSSYYNKVVDKALEQIKLAIKRNENNSSDVLDFYKESLIGKAFIDALKKCNKADTYIVQPSRDAIMDCLAKIINRKIAREGVNNSDVPVLKALGIIK